MVDAFVLESRTTEQGDQGQRNGAAEQRRENPLGRKRLSGKIQVHQGVVLLARRLDQLLAQLAATRAQPLGHIRLVPLGAEALVVPDRNTRCCMPDEDVVAPPVDERVAKLNRFVAAAEVCVSELHRVQEVLEELRPLRKAADQGDGEARRKLEKVYTDAKLAAREFDESIQRYREAAERGDAPSQRKLGELLVTGAPVVMDLAELESWMSAVRDWMGKFRERMQAIEESGEA